MVIIAQHTVTTLLASEGLFDILALSAVLLHTMSELSLDQLTQALLSVLENVSASPDMRPLTYEASQKVVNISSLGRVSAPILQSLAHQLCSLTL